MNLHAEPPLYSIVIPTYARPDALAECLESVRRLDYPRERLEVLVVDNGASDRTRQAAAGTAGNLTVRYLPNRRNRGYGYSVNRGIAEARGDRVMLLNDDARPMPDVLRQCERLLDGDPDIGCVGCRAIEAGYRVQGSDIGRLDESGDVIGNFTIDCGDPIPVEHVYGFCYVFTREAINRAGLNDQTLLAQPYSSGNRIETDHCLAIRAHGLKVIYHPGMAVLHLAKPRADMSEISARWKRNAIRNTLYLYLKHYGLWGKRGAALRLTFLVDIGLLSTLRRPNASNITYLLNGVRSRASAYVHWALHVTGARNRSLKAFLARSRRLDGMPEQLPVDPESETLTDLPPCESPRVESESSAGPVAAPQAPDA